MKQFHPLKIERIEPETNDSVRIALAVPAEHESDYEFLPGQHLPLEIEIGGRKPTLIEWDTDVPDWPALEAEAARTAVVLEGVA